MLYTAILNCIYQVLAMNNFFFMMLVKVGHTEYSIYTFHRTAQTFDIFKVADRKVCT
jgi:hypothetical protein